MPQGLVAGALTVVLLPAALAVAAVGAYLTLLGTAALVVPRREPPVASRHRRFAVLVPAHNEAGTIARLLTCLRTQAYPQTAVDTFVVADNCTDATADIARRSGAIVHERSDRARRAKGHALRWLLERVHDRGTFDAYIVLDGDSVVPQDFVARMNARLEAGSRVVQAHYRVLNASDSTTSALREAALASLHYLRPLGRAALGLSCGLKGNGMCFDASVLERYGWSTTGLAEDVELHLALVGAGVRVDFAPEVTVSADMPATLRDAASQNFRWEAGRLDALRRQVPALLSRGVRQADPVLLDAAAEQLIPPLSVAFAGGAAVAALGVFATSPTASFLALFGTLAIMAHVVAGLVATRAPMRTYTALAIAPRYVLWKIALYARAMIAPADTPWVRTSRRTGDAPRD